MLSRWTSRRATNQSFYRADRRSPWYMVAFGMVGASISGVTFVSVPGMVQQSQMTYLQMCLGFVVGYVVVAFILLPLYYRLNLTSIYTYLGQRLGRRSYLSGAWFFLLSKMTGAALKFYVVCMILQRFVFDGVGVPFWVNVVGLVLLIYVYMRHTKQGYEIAVIGDSMRTAQYAGMNVGRIMMRTMFLSGAISGLVGFIICSGATNTLSKEIAGGVGFTSITVAWLSQLNPFAMIAISLMLAILTKGASTLQSTTLSPTAMSVPVSISDIIIGMLLFCMLGCEFFINYKLILRKKAGKGGAGK